MTPFNIRQMFQRISASSSFFVLGLFGFLLFAGSGCQSSNPQEKALMQNQLTRIDERVGSIHKSIKVQANMAANIERLEGAIATLTGLLEVSNHRADSLSKKVVKLERRVAELTKVIANANPQSGQSSENMAIIGNIERDMAALSMETSRLAGLIERQNRQSSPKVAEAKPEPRVAKPEPVIQKLEPGELYQRSYNSYLKGDYSSSIDGFSEYISLYPNTELSDNAAYWVGEAYLGSKENVLAAKAFDKVAARYPTSNKAPTALLKSANALLEVDDKGAAMERLKAILDVYPASNEALTASDKLMSLGSN